MKKITRDLKKHYRGVERDLRDFQTWIYLDGHDGVDDALYFHTENPECDFPYWLDNFEWNN